jgi:hypothetical protein
MVNDRLLGALDALGVRVDDPLVAGDRLRLANMLYGSVEREVVDALQGPDSPDDPACGAGDVDTAGRWEGWQLPVAVKWRLCRLASTLERMVTGRPSLDPALMAAHQAVMLTLSLLIFRMSSDLVRADLQLRPDVHRRLDECVATALRDAEGYSDTVADAIVGLQAMANQNGIRV